MIKRVLSILSTAQLLIGFICTGVGVAWISLHFLHDDFKASRQSLPDYAYLVMLPEIILGFLIFLTGCLGLCFKRKKSAVAGIFVVSNVFNIFLWVPLLIVGYTFLVLTIFDGVGAYCWNYIDGERTYVRCLPDTWKTYNMSSIIPTNKEWVYVFPGVGIATGFLEFIFSFICLIAFCAYKEKSKVIVNSS